MEHLTWTRRNRPAAKTALPGSPDTDLKIKWSIIL
jgi:hypothetical protein